MRLSSAALGTFLGIGLLGAWVLLNDSPRSAGGAAGPSQRDGVVAGRPAAGGMLESTAATARSATDGLGEDRTAAVGSDPVATESELALFVRSVPALAEIQFKEVSLADLRYEELDVDTLSRLDQFLDRLGTQQARKHLEATRGNWIFALGNEARLDELELDGCAWVAVAPREDSGLHGSLAPRGVGWARIPRSIGGPYYDVRELRRRMAALPARAMEAEAAKVRIRANLQAVFGSFSEVSSPLGLETYFFGDSNNLLNRVGAYTTVMSL